MHVHMYITLYVHGVVYMYFMLLKQDNCYEFVTINAFLEHRFKLGTVCCQGSSHPHLQGIYM